MAKKVYNITAMRPAIIKAHNNGNTKAISKDFCEGAEVSIEYLNEWIKNVNALRATVVDYVEKKHNRWCKDSKIDDGAVVAAYERIFPKWKEVLSWGEAEKHVKELHVSERDVEDLIGFAWQFTATKNGTVIAPTADNKFRRLVEALVGCAIARNAVLTDEQRETLEKYYSAQKSVQNCTDRISELETTAKNWRMMKKADTSADFAKFIDGQEAIVKKEIEAVQERKTKADETANELAAAATEIERLISMAI